MHLLLQLFRKQSHITKCYLLSMRFKFVSCNLWNNSCLSKKIIIKFSNMSITSSLIIFAISVRKLHLKGKDLFLIHKNVSMEYLMLGNNITQIIPRLCQ